MSIVPTAVRRCYGMRRTANTVTSQETCLSPADCAYTLLGFIKIDRFFFSLLSVGIGVVCRVDKVLVM
jgi:hypothetical protein